MIDASAYFLAFIKSDDQCNYIQIDGDRSRSASWRPTYALYIKNKASLGLAPANLSDLEMDILFVSKLLGSPIAGILSIVPPEPLWTSLPVYGFAEET